MCRSGEPSASVEALVGGPGAPPPPSWVLLGGARTCEGMQVSAFYTNGMHFRVVVAGSTIWPPETTTTTKTAGKQQRSSTKRATTHLGTWRRAGQRRDLVAEQQRIAEAGNRKRSSSQKGIPKAEAKERGGAKSPPTLKPGRKAKAAASGADVGAVKRGDALAAKHRELGAHDAYGGHTRPAGGSR